jgi:hypothetical protein
MRWIASVAVPVREFVQNNAKRINPCPQERNCFGI